MDVQDHATHTTPSGHLCLRCGWPFPNPHPSSKHRRSHKKICGTIEGYTILTGSDVVSDDEHHSDDDKEKTPSPKIEKKISIGGDVSGIRGSFSRSEEDLFSDAVTEFPDSGTSQGSAHKTLDRDLFFSFNDAGNGDTNVEKIVETKITKPELTGTDGQPSDGLVKDEVVDPTPFETITEETKDSEISKTTPEDSAIVGGYDDNGKPEIDSVCETVSEVKESKTVEGEAGISEKMKVEKIDLDHEITSEIVKESEIDQNILILNEKEEFSTPKEQIQEVVIEPIAVLSEIKDREVLESEKCSKEQIQEIVKEPDTVLTEKEDLGGPHMRKQSNDEKPDSVPIESQDLVAPILGKSSKEQIQEIVKEPDTVLTEKEDLGGPHMRKQSNDEKPDSVPIESQDLVAPILEKEIVVEEPVSILTETQNLVTPESEKCSKETAKVVTEQKVDDVSNVVADVSVETISVKDSSESNSKQINNQDSVLSTASTDAESLETTEKSKVNPKKSIPSDTEPEGKDTKPASSEVQDLKQQPLTKVNTESEVRKKSEEAIAEVTGKQSTPLKNLLGEAKSPSGRQSEKMEKNEESAANEANSPPKLIEDGKKGRKKVKGIGSWMPFACCSSVNTVN